jgi:hypothetical protein
VQWAGWTWSKPDPHFSFHVLLINISHKDNISEGCGSFISLQRQEFHVVGMQISAVNHY